MQTILTGIRCNDELTLGNYLGAMLPLVKMAKEKSDEYLVALFVPDLHSFTTPIDHDGFYQRSMNNLKMFVAAGLPIDLENAKLYRQSRISAHSELCVILNNFAPFGELYRQPQFRDRQDTDIISDPESPKSIKEIRKYIVELENNKSIGKSDILTEIADLALKGKLLQTSKTTAGYFDYPVLMASDMLLYGAKYVPVGDDQRHHLEFTRDIARRFNNKFGEVFQAPADIKEQARFAAQDDSIRIMSLTNPEKKMSKSVKDPNGTILLSDDPKVAAKKVMSATTDSVGQINFDKVNQPGITNLLILLALLENKPQDEINSEFVGQTQYGELKKRVADAVEKTLTDLQEAFKNVDEAKLKAKLEQSEEQMREIANQTLLKVQKAVGLRE